MSLETPLSKLKYMQYKNNLFKIVRKEKNDSQSLLLDISSFDV